jgi:hypothetical protein
MEVAAGSSGVLASTPLSLPESQPTDGWAVRLKSIADHESTPTTKLYDGTRTELSLGEVERIKFELTLANGFVDLPARMIA